MAATAAAWKPEQDIPMDDDDIDDIFNDAKGGICR